MITYFDKLLEWELTVLKLWVAMELLAKSAFWPKLSVLLDLRAHCDYRRCRPQLQKLLLPSFVPLVT